MSALRDQPARPLPRNSAAWLPDFACSCLVHCCCLLVRSVYGIPGRHHVPGDAGRDKRRRARRGRRPRRRVMPCAFCWSALWCCCRAVVLLVAAALGLRSVLPCSALAFFLSQFAETARADRALCCSCSSLEVYGLDSTTGMPHQVRVRFAIDRQDPLSASCSRCACAITCVWFVPQATQATCVRPSSCFADCAQSCACALSRLRHALALNAAT